MLVLGKTHASNVRAERTIGEVPILVDTLDQHYTRGHLTLAQFAHVDET